MGYDSELARSNIVKFVEGTKVLKFDEVLKFMYYIITLNLKDEPKILNKYIHLLQKIKEESVRAQQQSVQTNEEEERIVLRDREINNVDNVEVDELNKDKE